MKFEVKGEPQGKARPRVTRMRTYTPRRTKEYESRIRAAYLEADGKRIDEPVFVTIRAVFGVPKSWSKRKRAEAFDGAIAVQKKPDADNIAKVVLDALNGVAYKDDAQVYGLSVMKVWEEGEGAGARVEVDVIEGRR